LDDNPTMDPLRLGYDAWFAERAAGLLVEGRSAARVTAVDRGAYLVRVPKGEIPAEPSGRMLFQAESQADLPSVGDWVAVQVHSGGTAAVIHAIWPRRSFLRRKQAGETIDHQMIAANIDSAFVVQSCHYDFNLRRLDRYLVMAADGGVEPVILLTKTDLVSADAVQRMRGEIRRHAAAPRVLDLSSRSGAGLDTFREALMPGKTYCLLGSSGVGKTTLINRLMGEETFETGAVSQSGEGRHVTSRRQLVPLPGGALLVDTPGMRELGLVAAGEGLQRHFDRIAALAAQCRFADCSHGGEPGCAVQAAMAGGDLEPEHYANFLKLKQESDFHARSHAERRKRDKAFGRMCKAVVKRIRK
jgi:ribosome biogenesis GTPase